MSGFGGIGPVCQWLQYRTLVLRTEVGNRADPRSLAHQDSVLAPSQYPFGRGNKQW